MSKRIRINRWLKTGTEYRRNEQFDMLDRALRNAWMKSKGLNGVLFVTWLKNNTAVSVYYDGIFISSYSMSEEDCIKYLMGVN